MARLRRAAVESSEAAVIPSRSRSAAPDTDSPAARPARRKGAVQYSIPDDSDDEEEEAVALPHVPKQTGTSQVRKPKTQIRLAPLQSLSSLSDLTIQEDTPERTRRRSPWKQNARQLVHNKTFKTGLGLSPPPSPAPKRILEPSQGRTVADQDEEEVDSELDVEASLWCGSESDDAASEDDLPSASTLFPGRQKQSDLATQMEALSIFDHDGEPSLNDRPATTKAPKSTLRRPPSSSDKENQDAIIRFSPPRCKKPAGREPMERPSTPPLPPPAPSKLKSPSKRAPRIPTPPPGRPGLEAFWTAGAVNDWNDQYSPQKPLRSPRKLFDPPTKTFDDTSITSPAKLQSPSKRSKAEIQARKDWDTRKITIAEKFLTELDQTLTQGQIAQLAESTGGVKLIWSKTLNSTAGRANWRKETTKSHSRSDPTKLQIFHKHFASIELAEKVLTHSEDCETKLLNVLAHEFCHLTNFMISGVKDQPHGASFKQWGRLASRVFGERGVEVTTKHSYEIEYKFVWKCEDEECGMEFKRHSKSIDTKRHRCGRCKANLLQIRPVLRGGGSARNGVDEGAGGKGVPPLQVNGYAAYVKEHFAILKRSMPGAAHKEVMKALGKQYREEKASQTNTNTVADEVVEKLKEVKLSVQEVIELE